MKRPNDVRKKAVKRNEKVVTEEEILPKSHENLQNPEIYPNLNKDKICFSLLKDLVDMELEEKTTSVNAKTTTQSNAEIIILMELWRKAVIKEKNVISGIQHTFATYP